MSITTGEQRYRVLSSLIWALRAIFALVDGRTLLDTWDRRRSAGNRAWARQSESRGPAERAGPPERHRATRRWYRVGGQRPDEPGHPRLADIPRRYQCADRSPDRCPRRVRRGQRRSPARSSARARVDVHLMTRQATRGRRLSGRWGQHAASAERHRCVHGEHERHLEASSGNGVNALPGRRQGLAQRESPDGACPVWRRRTRPGAGASTPVRWPARRGRWPAPPGPGRRRCARQPSP
jgi:hypothetical protein